MTDLRVQLAKQWKQMLGDAHDPADTAGLYEIVAVLIIEISTAVLAFGKTDQFFTFLCTDGGKTMIAVVFFIIYTLSGKYE